MCSNCAGRGATAWAVADNLDHTLPLTCLALVTHYSEQDPRVAAPHAAAGINIRAAARALISSPLLVPRALNVMSGTVAPLSPSATITRLDEVQPYDKLQWIMQRAHSVIKQGYASIMKHLDNPPLDDLTNFIGYCDSWVGCIVNHHDSEEATLFPALARHLDMSTEQSQHKVMHDHLDDIHAYLTHPDTLQSFSAEKLREKMLAVRDVLFDHLDAEIKHLGRENLEPHWSAEELDAMLNALDDHAKAHVDLWTELPFAIGHVPPPYRGNFPAFPWIMRVTVIPVIALRYSGRWKYCPYNAFSMSD